MLNEIKYAHHDMDPVLMKGDDALIFINGHWQGMSFALAFSEAKLMAVDQFYNVFGAIADRVPPTAWDKV